MCYICCRWVSDSSLWPHGLQHARPLCPSLSPGFCSDSCPLNRWCYLTISCLPLLLLPSIFPSIRVFSKESALHIKWPKYWSFSFSINPSSEYSGFIFQYAIYLRSKKKVFCSKIYDVLLTACGTFKNGNCAIFVDLTFHHTSFSCPDFLLEKSLWRPKKKKKKIVLSADLSEFPFYVIRVNNVCESWKTNISKLD